MRTLDEYMQLPYRMEVQPVAEGGCVVFFPELKGCLTCAERLEDASSAGADARKAWLSAALAEDYPIPEPGAFAEIAAN